MTLPETETDGAAEGATADSNKEIKLSEETESPAVTENISEDKSIKSQSDKEKLKNKKPKPIMIRDIVDIIEFTDNIEKHCYIDFVAAMSEM